MKGRKSYQLLTEEAQCLMKWRWSTRYCLIGRFTNEEEECVQQDRYAILVDITAVILHKKTRQPVSVVKLTLQSNPVVRQKACSICSNKFCCS